MRSTLRLLSCVSCLSWLLLSARAADLAPALTTPPPSDWIDPDTGHRVIRLSPDTGGSSLYFHQNGYTPEGDKLIIHTRTDTPGIVDLATVNLTTLGLSPPKLAIVAPATRAIATAWRTREAYVRRDATIVAIHLDTNAERLVIALPPQAQGRGGAFALNCDESLLVGITRDPDGKTLPRTAPPGGMGPFPSIATGMIGMPMVPKRTPRASRQPLCPPDQSAASSSSGFKAGCWSACAASGSSSTC